MMLFSSSPIEEMLYPILYPISGHNDFVFSKGASFVPPKYKASLSFAFPPSGAEFQAGY